jgi:hypothetical protein
LRASERLARAILAFLLVYGLIVAHAVFLQLTEHRTSEEIFPFFKWDLFSRVPNSDQEDYGIRFVEVDGRPVDPPVYFEEADELISTSRSPDAQSTIRNIGRAVEHDQPVVLAENRALFEGRQLQGLDSATYEVVKRRYDLIERIDCVDCFEDETVLDEFTMGS